MDHIYDKTRWKENPTQNTNKTHRYQNAMEKYIEKNKRLWWSWEQENPKRPTGFTGKYDGPMGFV